MVMRLVDLIKRRVLVVLLVFFGVVALVVLGGIIYRTIIGPEIIKVRLGTGVFQARLADTPAKRERGLSGSAPLGADQAMLFVFDRDEQWGIWMKDMHYPIDIVWLDRDKTVTQIAHSVQPSTYPKQTFKSSMPSRYVVELPAGSAERYFVAIGSKAIFAEGKRP